MRTVWKFPIPPEDEFELPIPIGHKVVHVGLQGGQPHMWIEVDDSEPVMPRWFHIVRTGKPVPTHGSDYRVIHRGTVQLLGGALVCHLYEEVFDGSR